MKEIKKYCEDLRAVLLGTDNGHLPLSFRVKLMQLIKSSLLANKIMFECAKKVYSLWEEEYPDLDIVQKMLLEVNGYLYESKGAKDDFIQIADKHKNFIEGIDSNAGAVGLAALNLCYGISMDASFNNDADDDSDLEYEDRWSDYYASLAFSGGSPFSLEGDIEKRIEFWSWYISMAEALICNLEKPILPMPEKKIVQIKADSFNRTQTYKNKKSEALIQEAIRMTVDFLKEREISYSSFRLDINCVVFTNTYSLYITKNNKEEKLFLSVMDQFDFSPVKEFYEMKLDMYTQSPEEGAWLNCSLVVDKENNYKLDFNYDDESRLYDPNTKIESLAFEFEKFPRKIDFIPDWWRRMLGKKFSG